MADFNSDKIDLDKDMPKKGPDSISFNSVNASGNDEISHAPLDLGGHSASIPAPVKQQTPAPVPVRRPAAPATAPVPIAGPAPVAALGRITGVKIFFTKLHAGAVDFLSEQIMEWLKANPNIIIKQTNAVVGEIAAKKTEPNLIITCWY